MKKYFLSLMALLTTACHPSSYLTCRTEYLYPTYLAGENINTPDPRRACFYGQQLIVRWDLPKEYQHEEIELQICIRYGTGEIETRQVPICKRHGWWVFRLINRDYWCREGILSFKAQLVQEGKVIDQWTHYLWVDLIQICST